MICLSKLGLIQVFGAKWALNESPSFQISEHAEWKWWARSDLNARPFPCPMEIIGHTGYEPAALPS